MRPRFLADENVDLGLVLGLQRRVDGVDIVRVPRTRQLRNTCATGPPTLMTYQAHNFYLNDVGASSP